MGQLNSSWNMFQNQQSPLGTQQPTNTGYLQPQGQQADPWRQYMQQPQSQQYAQMNYQQPYQNYSIWGWNPQGQGGTGMPDISQLQQMMQPQIDVNALKADLLAQLKAEQPQAAPPPPPAPPPPRRRKFLPYSGGHPGSVGAAGMSGRL